MFDIYLVICLHLSMLLTARDIATCPSCEKKGLFIANGTDKVGKRLVVCENEHVIHWAIGGNHFLTRTELNVREENYLIFYGNEGNLVMN